MEKLVKSEDSESVEADEFKDDPILKYNSSISSNDF